MGDLPQRALGALAQVSGLTDADVRAIHEQVKANLRRLEACTGPHRFAEIDPGKFGTRNRCATCGGEVSGAEARWYARGFAHGGGDLAQLEPKE